MSRIGHGVAAFAACALLATNAIATLPFAGDPPRGKALAEKVCAACHRADGNSIDPEYPKLAGQGARYLYEQLLAFKAQGHRRSSGVMGAIAVNLSDTEMRDLAAHFAAQLPRDGDAERVPISARQLARGESIYREGLARSPAVPACASCHALSGAGLAPAFPRLAGQHPQYLVKQLDDFRFGRRNSDPDQMMSQVAHKLSERDIEAVAGYIARLR